MARAAGRRLAQIAQSQHQTRPSWERHRGENSLWHKDCPVVREVSQIGCAMFDRKRILFYIAAALMMFGLAILQFYVLEKFVDPSLQVDSPLILLSIVMTCVGSMAMVFLQD